MSYILHSQLPIALTSSKIELKINCGWMSRFVCVFVESFEQELVKENLVIIFSF